MSDHPIEGMMNTSLERIKQMVDVNSIIGDPITAPDGTVIIPVSKISYGFASGGSDFSSKQPAGKDLFGGGTGAGITISPVAFLTVSKGNVRMLQIDPYNSSADRIVSMVPDVVDKVNEIISKKKEDKERKTAPASSAAEGTEPEKPQI